MICFCFAGASIAWLSNNADDHFYLDLDDDPGAGEFFILIFTFVVAYSHLIPISLYVALEIVKMVLAYMI
jgi:magnesium-transporting ATPase (P-type)